MFNFNQEIETVLDELNIPIAFLFYEGEETTYIVYSQTDKESPMYGDDGIRGCIQYYDFDIYSQENYLDYVTQLTMLLEAEGWTYDPSRDSPDMYETDTKFYHKTICLWKESEVTNG